MTKKDIWIDLDNPVQLNAIDEESQKGLVVIFKHSTSCAISTMAWSRFNRGMTDDLPNPVKFYYLDLLNYRVVSNAVAEKYDVRHESPQILVIFKNQCVHNASHMAISFSKVKELNNTN